MVNLKDIFIPIREDKINFYPILNEVKSSFDLFTPTDAIVKPNAIANIPSGFQIRIPLGYIGLISPKYGIASKNAMYCPSQIIHPNDESEIQLNFVHFGFDAVRFYKGDAVAQLTIIKTLHME